MSAPIIGLNVNVRVVDIGDRAECNLSYIDAVRRAGGVPLLLPWDADAAAVKRVLPLLDGVCLIGGPDIHPEAYGGHPQDAEELVHPRRHRADQVLIQAVLASARLPVLGICGGMQLLLVGSGGALVQDLAGEWPGPPALLHAVDQRDGDRAWQHPLRVAAGSRLATILGSETVLTNSFHHQAADPQRLGGLRAVAWAEDGVIEAVEGDGERFLIGVQWHPEREVADAVAAGGAGETASERLFRAFVAAAAG